MSKGKQPDFDAYVTTENGDDTICAPHWRCMESQGGWFNNSTELSSRGHGARSACTEKRLNLKQVIEKGSSDPFSFCSPSPS